MITFHVERMADMIAEAAPLLEAHWEEIAHNQDKIKLNPDYKQYEIMETMGMLHIVTARDEGRLVGYCITFLVRHLHYSDHVYAMNDILYVRPENRRGSVGARLIHFTEERLAELGCSVTNYHIKPEHDFSPLLIKQGYKLTEYQYGKYIGG